MASSSSSPASAVVVAEGSAARRFWIAASTREAAFAAYTPFLLSLAAGNLRLDAFRHYIAQDAHFLHAFARASGLHWTGSDPILPFLLAATTNQSISYEMSEDCADDDDDRATIAALRKAILQELNLHASVLKEWGVDPTKEIPPSAATTKYTDFLLATAAGKVDGAKGSDKMVTPFEKTKIAAYTVGAMTPCMRLYAHLGKELAVFLKQDENHPYKKWINTYASSDFEDNALQIEELLDKLSVSLTGEELEIIGKLYQQAMKLEVEFFSAQLVDQPVVAPLSRYCDPKYKLLIFSDFDLTCTVVDSSAILAEIAILSFQKSSQSGVDNTLDRAKSADLRNSWNMLSKQYMEEYEECMERLLPPEESKSLDYDQLYKGLEMLAEFEKLANSRVVDSGVLRGMNLEDIRKAGERLILQDGCKNFFQRIGKTRESLNLDIHILSYCWCAELIRSAFSSVGCLDGLNIHSNEFAFEGSVSTGQIDRKMQSPLDKVEKFKSIKSGMDSTAPLLSVYIGDSVGDLLCLLEADIGIVVGSSTSLRRVGKQFGVSFVPLFPVVVEKQRQLTEQEASVFKARSGVLYTVSSWSEILAFILGSDFS
ncbi:putative aminopyrimidine aminohydrolase, mitochondrial [Dichanthelium oligosanthes]|uniref:Putative aminopyrimidine aminohydrolase, mitochondrial n=1 Tax=Dichanthelium oligosanthes TaxID=888268 RepID=A0A1E5UWJ5_9POAL|nr:putative aminopyrimidine aminohydrolase, mitochondrial [Dichanthelium oligosanthes]